MSLARRNSLTSRYSALTRSCSAVATPERWHISRSYWRTQRRSVSAVQPILRTIYSIAAHYNSYCSQPSKARRAARSITSSKYRGDFFFITPFSQMLEPPRFPGQLTLCINWRAASSNISRTSAATITPEAALCSTTERRSIPSYKRPRRSSASHAGQRRRQRSSCRRTMCRANPVHTTGRRHPT